MANEVAANDTMVPTDGASLTQEAAGSDPAARPVATPEGQPIALIPVAPGQVIELPYRADELSAKLGENGNLAIRIGDRTIVLQGYVAAEERAAVTLLGSDGQPIDVVAILAATDPNLDIVTAAGPATGASTAGGRQRRLRSVRYRCRAGGFDSAGACGTSWRIRRSRATRRCSSPPKKKARGQKGSTGGPARPGETGPTGDTVRQAPRPVPPARLVTLARAATLARARRHWPEWRHWPERRPVRAVTPVQRRQWPDRRDWPEWRHRPTATLVRAETPARPAMPVERIQVRR